VKIFDRLGGPQLETYLQSRMSFYYPTAEFIKSTRMPEWFGTGDTPVAVLTELLTDWCSALPIAA
jgi:hypothetical protein